MNKLTKGKFFPKYWASDSVEQSRHIVLDYEAYDFESRWANETKFTMELISRYTNINSNSTVLDYGSGVGRLSKAIVERFDCHVDGYEPAEDLRKHSVEYVNNSKFSTVSDPKSYDLIVCAWVALLIHDLDELYELFSSLLNPEGKVLVIDYNHQLLTDDGVEYTRVTNNAVKSKLEQHFNIVSAGKVPDAFINREWTKAHTFDWDDTFWAFGEKLIAI